jgi:glucose-1-phosphate thymidylyltransferase
MPFVLAPKKMKAIILAGGFATRLWPLTEKTAKPLLEIAGKPILSYITEKIANDIPIIISTNAVFADAFEKWKSEYSRHSDSEKNQDIQIFIEDSHGEKGKKGALAAVSLVLKEFGTSDDILVLAGDNLFFFDMEGFLKNTKQHPLLAAYDVKKIHEAKKFGVVVPVQTPEIRCQTSGKENVGADPHVCTKDNQSLPKTIAEFQEKPEHPKSTLVSTGCLYFPKRLLKELMKYSEKHNDDLGGVFEHFLSIGETVEYYDFHEGWFDIGSFPAFLEAQKYVLGKQIKDAGAIQKGKNIFSGSVYLAKGAVIEDSLLENVIVQKGSVIRNARVRNSVIGKNAVVSNVDISGIALREESFVTRE